MGTMIRCGSSFASLCSEDRLVDRCGRLHLIRPFRLAAKRWWAASGILPAVAIPARSRVKSSTAVCSIHVDPSDGKSCVNAVTGPCSESICDDVNKVGGRDRAPVPPEKIDKWMHDCIVEIVRKIGEAPFLVHVFANGDGAALKLEMETADPMNWRVIRSKWDGGAAPPPDGIILVEELKGEESDQGIAATSTTTWSGEDDACSGTSAGSKTWGILVQGWGVDCAACYILSTCRVRSTFGFCTHFCLTRARCFEETADVQLKKSWVVGRPHRQQRPQ